MSKPTLPTVIIGRTIRRLRQEAGLSQAQLAKKCRWSEAKLSFIENGKNAISLFDVAGVCRILETPADLTRQLERMSDEADTPGWWESYASGLVNDFSMYLELEQVCAELWIYESDVVTGLLQAEAYARAINATNPNLDEEALEKSVELRTTRQERFWSRNPLPEICIVMSEYALTRPICIPEGDLEQRKRILDVAEYPKVDIRVLPTNAGPHASMASSYVILTSGIPEISDVVYTESITGATYDETDEVVERCRTFFTATREKTIPVKEFFNDNRRMA